MPRKPRATEVDAYIFIKNNLKTLGWDTRNPARVPTGQVYTQNECLADPEISRWLLLRRPEAIVKVAETVLWVIEAKRSHRELDQAVREAEDYADSFHPSASLSAKFVSGVAGNELDSFLVRSRYLNGSAWAPITLNGIEATGLLSPEQARDILVSDNPELSVPAIDDKLFLSRANHINEILHLGAVNPHQRAGVMAALLLAMLSDTPPNIQERSPSVLIGDINSRVQAVLRQQGKPEFYDYIRIALPTTPDNHFKFRKALVDTIQELNNLNIRSAMNSGADWLGSFYEVFLKYASWAQDLGIVLTPRHITRYAAVALDIRPNDIIYDPTCGTGGFLVAAFDYVRRHATAPQVDRFKQHGLFGVEQDAGVASLAVVNMIFRGDGKNNIREGNCFATFLAPHIDGRVTTAQFTTSPSEEPPVTKVMMNPPFALRRSDEKEFKFVDQALLQMEHGGLLFSILPYSAMVRPGTYLDWRKHILLPNHTLLAVVTFPPELFYPVGVTTLGVFIKKGVPHLPEQPVLWLRAVTDGLQISKGKRLPNGRAGNDLDQVRDVLRNFVHDPSQPASNIEQTQKVELIDFADRHLELVPEAYLDQKVPSDAEIQTGIEQSVRDTFAYLVKIDRAVLRPELLSSPPPPPVPSASQDWRPFKVTELFALKRGDFHAIEDLDPGPYPTISRIATDNGFVGFYEKPDAAHVWPPKTITVSTVTGDAFVQPQPFIVTDNVVLCVPEPGADYLPLTSLFFIQFMLNAGKWRYSYGRQCYKPKFAVTEIRLPVTAAGNLDHEIMAAFVERAGYWLLVKAGFDTGG